MIRKRPKHIAASVSHLCPWARAVTGPPGRSGRPGSGARVSAIGRRAGAARASPAERAGERAEEAEPGEERHDVVGVDVGAQPAVGLAARARPRPRSRRSRRGCRRASDAPRARRPWSTARERSFSESGTSGSVDRARPSARAMPGERVVRGPLARPPPGARACRGLLLEHREEELQLARRSAGTGRPPSSAPRGRCRRCWCRGSRARRTGRGPRAGGAASRSSRVMRLAGGDGVAERRHRPP